MREKKIKSMRESTKLIIELQNKLIIELQNKLI